MVRAENIESKLASLKSYLELLRRYKTMDIEKIKNDPDLRGALERYLYLSAQCSIDLAEMLIKFRKLGKADSMSENFSILEQAHVIPKNLADKLISMVGFRNVLSHGYEHLNYDIVSQILKDADKDLMSLADAIEENLGKQSD